MYSVAVTLFVGSADFIQLLVVAIAIGSATSLIAELLE